MQKTATSLFVLRTFILSLFYLSLLLPYRSPRVAWAQTQSTPTPLAAHSEATPIKYIVVDGDTLYIIALRHNTNVHAIRTANGLSSDLLSVGQQLVIPAAINPISSALNEVLAPATPVAPTRLRHTIITGDLAAAYPAQLATDAFVLHYSPDLPPTYPPERLALMINNALRANQQLLNLQLPRSIDVYVAGALFAPPDQALLGRSFSGEERLFLLNDGTGSVMLQQYVIAHELAHMAAWHTYGIPHSLMLSEGTAVYAGMQMIGDARLLTIDDFCLAYSRAGKLPRVTSELAYRGHLRNLDNYYAAGCFVQFLIERYGVEKFGRLYGTGQYAKIYGKSFPSLEAEWLIDLVTNTAALPFVPHDLVHSVESVKSAHQQLFAVSISTPEQVAAYRELDAVWTALFEGRITEVVAYFSG